MAEYGFYGAMVRYSKQLGKLKHPWTEQSKTLNKDLTIKIDDIDMKWNNAEHQKVKWFDRL